jgi:uncharacterized protein (TIGR02996 family)
MNEDAAFIRALRERPDDETARLVYADWLDDRSDPRAEYLRAEAAWVALPPSDEQYRPLYRRVSQLAAALDPEWFVAVSRLGHVVRRGWETVSEGFNPRRLATDLPREWAEAVGVLRSLFADAFGAEEAERRFCVPADFVVFPCVVGGLDNGWDTFYSSLGVVKTHQNNVHVFGPRHPPDHLSAAELAERPTNPEMWLEFGGWSDKHYYFVCCDLGSPLFGVVAEAHDYHPWMAGSDGMDYRGRNFLHFLTGYWPLYRDREVWEKWPRVPHAKWATF